MKVYVTTYALTKGIIEKNGNLAKTTNLIFKSDDGAYFHKPNWYENLEDTRNKAETMRIDKILSLNKTLKKIEKLKF